MKMIKYCHGSSLLAFLYVLALSAFLILLFSRWQNQLQQEAMRRYWENQAQLIAENQLSLQWLKLGCESLVLQNKASFQIRCVDDNVFVTHPLGEFQLKNR